MHIAAALAEMFGLVQIYHPYVLLIMSNSLSYAFAQIYVCFSCDLVLLFYLV